jgi:hypothetical protein
MAYQAANEVQKLFGISAKIEKAGGGHGEPVAFSARE